ncbi:MAG: dihydroorotate dehydrogenase-like protein [Bacteroidales bacterium]|nr:dihydroorotate dehydrogenase-like protein [Bacteroidales bacterium]
MKNLSCNYAGITLKNPIVIASSNLVLNEQTLEQIIEAGAGAIVFKTLFEEQIELEKLQMLEEMTAYEDRHAEMMTLFPKLQHAGPEEHLVLLTKAVKKSSIPIIGSLNCIDLNVWTEFAKKMQDTGIAALELNLSTIPTKDRTTSQELENEMMTIVEKVAHVVTIPIIVKINSFITHVPYLAKKLENAGAKGIVLFNRLFQPDIDVTNENFAFSEYLSNSKDNRITLRFIGLLYGNVNMSLIANTGFHTSTDVIKALLVGADAVQILSTLYLNKITYITTMLNEIDQWMNNKNYQSLEDFRGKLSKRKTTDPFAYRRAQYIDILMSSDNFLNRNMLI